jgi:casein kinase II subunit beta
MPDKSETNSICSDDDTKEELEVKDKEEDDDEVVEGEEEEEEEDDDDDDDEEDEDEDDDEEFDPAIIQYELLKNFLTDEEGVNVATHLGTIAHELREMRKLMKIIAKK